MEGLISTERNYHTGSNLVDTVEGVAWHLSAKAMNCFSIIRVNYDDANKLAVMINQSMYIEKSNEQHLRFLTDLTSFFDYRAFSNTFPMILEIFICEAHRALSYGSLYGCKGTFGDIKRAL